MSRQVFMPIFLPASHKEGLALQAFPSLAIKGHTAKGFFHSTLAYILLPGSTAS